MTSLLRIKAVLLSIVMLGLVAVTGRFIFGLGAATAISDQIPWGMWKVMNMITGAALGTCGFVMALIVAVFRFKRFEPLLRPSMLIAFLGYAASLLALLLDIGLPWRFYHPLIYPNFHSFLFEVSVCVTLYFVVTAIEMIPVISEAKIFNNLCGLGRGIHGRVIPIAIVGITLSSMHHTGLGALFIPAIERLHPIWHSPIINWLFITSAMGAGLLTLVFVTLAYSALYNRKPDIELLGGVSFISVFFLGLYALLKALDLTSRGLWPAVMSGQFEGRLFQVESLLLVGVPVALTLNGKTRRSFDGLLAISFSAMAGLTLNRVDTGIIGFFRSAGSTYFPSLPEVFIGLGVLAAAALVFLLIVENFNIYGAPPTRPDNAPASHEPQGDTSSIAPLAAFLQLSMAAIISVSVAIPLFWGSALSGLPVVTDTAGAPRSAGASRAVFIIDGNRNGYTATFKHDAHRIRLGGFSSCAKCHHIKNPRDRITPCFHCHRRMEQPTDIFNHNLHINKLHGNKGCDNCHTDPAKPRWASGARDCWWCHEGDMGIARRADGARFNHKAVSHHEAMHRLCIGCHRKMNLSAGKTNAMEECRFCHQKQKKNRVK